MANKDVTRVGETSKKKDISIMVVAVDALTREEYQDASGNYLVGFLPEKAKIHSAKVFTVVASTAGAVTVGTTEGGADILSAGDTATPGASGTFTGESWTGTGKPVYVGLAAAATTGEFYVEIQYVEATKATGELTRITN